MKWLIKLINRIKYKAESNEEFAKRMAKILDTYALKNGN